MSGGGCPAARRGARWGIICTMLVAANGATIFGSPQPRLVWNASASAPTGLWIVSPDATIGRGDMVVARLAPRWRHVAATRHYLPSNVPLIKAVAAIAGDTVCAEGDLVTVNGEVNARRLRQDKEGRSLYGWSGCLVLRTGTMLLLTDHPASFDGRYFGPTKYTDILGKADPLWIR